MNPGDTPRRHLLRQEEQEEGTSAHRQEEVDEEIIDIPKISLVTTANTAVTTSSQRSHTMISCSSTSTSTANTLSSSSSASKTCAMRLKHRQVMQVGGGSTTSSSTEDSEARERRFGSIDLQQPLPLKTSSGAAIAGADLSKSQLPIDEQLKQALLADFSVFCPVHSQSPITYDPQLRGMKKYLPSLFRSPAVLTTYIPRLTTPCSSTDPLTSPTRQIGHSLSTGACVGPYRMERLLGRGNFAVVKLATHTQLNVPVAVKIINKELVGGQNLAKMARELEAMKRCYRHPNIVRLYHIMETDANIYMVMEYASRGEVFDHISLSHAFTEKEARELFWQIVCAIDYCHKLGIVHRDLKAENLLIDTDFKIKVADFGFCNFFTQDKLLTTHCGSPQYAAPELFKGESYDGPLVDVWSLGVILYILVCGSFPFPGESLGDIRSQVLRGLVRFPFFLSSACEQVIRGMLQVEPSKRLRLEQVTTTPWMQASPNLSHYTSLLAQYTSKARQQRADVLLQRQFPEHDSVITTTRCQRQMEGLDGGLVRALALATGANEEEIRKSTAQKSFDRLHAGYALLVDKIARFATNAKLREVVEIWIKNSSTMTATIIPASEARKVSNIEASGEGDNGRSAASKLMSWREEVEEEDEEPNQLKNKVDEDEVSITASAVQNLSVSQGADDQSADSSVSSPLPHSDLLNSWVNDFRAKRTDVRIALSILQANESQLIEEISDLEPDSTTKNFRRHTIQLPGPVVPKHPLEEIQSSTSEESSHGTSPLEIGQSQHLRQQQNKILHEGRNTSTEDGKEEGSGRGSLGSRIPRQITEPELGSWKLGGLQREAPGNIVGEGEFQWIPLASVPEAMAKFKISDVKEFSLDLGQEASNTRLPPRASPLPTNVEELAQPPGHSPNLQINVTVDYPPDLSPCGLSKKGLHSPSGDYNASESCWDSLPHCSTGEPLPQLDLPAYIPSMSHQPVARFTVKDPNLLAPPEFMTPYSSSFPRRSSDGAADMPTLHRPYPLFGGSYPEQANCRIEYHSETNFPQATYPVQLPVVSSDGHLIHGPNELMNLEQIDVEPAEMDSQQPRQPLHHQDTLPVISVQKRFSLPLRQAAPMVERPSSDKEVGKNYACCCDHLVNTFLAESQGKISMEAINTFKISLLQQGTVGILASPEFAESRNLSTHKSVCLRRGSEATQMRLWNQRITQLYGTSYTPTRRGAFSRWLSYETKDQLEALSQMIRQELRASASANVPKAVQLERSAVETQRSGSVPFAHRHQKSPKRLTICRVDSQHSLAMAESSESCDLGGSVIKRSGREGETLRVFRPHSSWNEKLTAGSRRRQTLPRSKSQVSWTDVKHCDSISLRNRLVDPAATEVGSRSELTHSEETPMDTTISGEEESGLEVAEDTPASTASLTALRRPPSLERKFNLDFLTNHRQKLYHDWLPKVSVISKRAVEALSSVCTPLPDTSNPSPQKQPSPLAQPHTSPSNLAVTPPEMALSSSPPSPEAMSDSPTDLPSAEIDEPPIGFNSFHHTQKASSSISPMFMPPFPTKLQIRSMDEDEDLAVIDQVNRRLAMGQLEPPLPWTPVPPGAGLLGYPSPSDAHYPETFTGPQFQHHQHQEQIIGSSTSQPEAQYFFPMETSGVTESPFQFNSAARMVYRPEGVPQLSPPVEDPQSEVEFTEH